jgi:type I restriction-modification system DNA methylase subunit
MTEYTQLTLDITHKLTKNEKKNGGIFITPRLLIEKLVSQLPDRQYPDILEPSAGTCEIVRYLDGRLSNVSIDAVEFNPVIYSTVSDANIQYRNATRYIHADFTHWVPDKHYDLIIGNPPYVVCSKDDVPEQYRENTVGRPNLFGTFILHAMTMLKPNGILAFIIPTSFLNAAYYAKIRNYMKQSGNILKIVDFSKDGGFLETQQTTFGLIFQKTTELNTICNHSIRFGDNLILTENADEIRKLLSGSTTLAKLGIRVRTGTIVWNQHKNKMTSDDTKTMLIYNSNIVRMNRVELLDFANDEKKQFIQHTGSNEPIIVVNRGNGNSAYKLNYAYVDGIRSYLVENHLNIIECRTETNARMILGSLENPRTLEFVSRFLGNNGLSKTELETIFPIFVDGC